MTKAASPTRRKPSMMDRLDPPEDPPEEPPEEARAPEQPAEGPYGLWLWGIVGRRWKRTLDTGTTIVSYEVSGIVVQQYNPNAEPYAIGEVVRLQVQVRAYNTKSGPRYSLVIPGPIEGEF